MNNDLISRSKLLKLFENLKKKSVNLRDVIYLEGVMDASRPRCRPP